MRLFLNILLRKRTWFSFPFLFSTSTGVIIKTPNSSNAARLLKIGLFYSKHFEVPRTFALIKQLARAF